MPAPQAEPRRRRKSRWPRILLWTTAGLLLLLFFIAGIGVLWLRSVTRAALPQLDGDVHLAGLSAPVIVRRDAHGVPHIDAASQDDLFVAQGYVTAQDRLWQMDSLRRAANGELAEVLGPSLLQNDETQRVLEIRLTAQRIYDRLQTDDRQRLDAYARGVNLFIAQCERAHTLPVEFHLLMYRPQPWRGVDSISVGLNMVQTLDTHVITKLSRARVEARLRDPRLIADLYPVGSWRDHPPTGTKVDQTKSQPRVVSSANDNGENADTHLAQAGATDPFALPAPAVMALLGLRAGDGCTPGSNNWVVAGSHTASGKPLLSNDMHLTLRIPDTWYMADLRAPGYHAAGVTLPGFPLIVAGHNEHVAWGFTALGADVQDLYIEKLDGEGNYLSVDAAWHPLTVDREVIRVRGGKDVDLNVESTDHGPLLNPLLPKGDAPTALKWTLYDPALNALPLYAMNVASNWTEFSSALSQWCWPTQNLVYADDHGHIAYHAVGKVPLRPAGLVDVPITGNAHEWQGYSPFDAMPGAFDPPSGFLATANSRVTTAQTPFPIADDWTDPYRVERIYKLLEGRDQLIPKDMLAVQTDIYSAVDQELGRRFASAIDHTPGPDGNRRRPDAPGCGPDAQLGWPPHHRFRCRLACYPSARRALATDSGTETRHAGKRLSLGREVLCRRRDRDARRPRVAAKELPDLGRAACRSSAERHERRPCALRFVEVDLRKLAHGRHRAPAGAISSAHRPRSRHRPADPERRRNDSQASGPHIRALATLHNGLEQYRRIDRKHRDG